MHFEIIIPSSYRHRSRYTDQIGRTDASPAPSVTLLLSRVLLAVRPRASQTSTAILKSDRHFAIWSTQTQTHTLPGLKDKGAAVVDRRAYVGKTAGSLLSRAPLVQNRPTQPALLLDEAQGCVVRTSIRAIEHFLSEGVGVVGPADRSVETQLPFAAFPSSRISPTRTPITCHLSLSHSAVTSRRSAIAQPVGSEVVSRGAGVH